MEKANMDIRQYMEDHGVTQKMLGARLGFKEWKMSTATIGRLRKWPAGQGGIMTACGSSLVSRRKPAGSLTGRTRKLSTLFALTWRGCGGR